jgi:hypothetical protein
MVKRRTRSLWAPQVGDLSLVGFEPHDSDTHSLISEDICKAKVLESGKPCGDFETGAFFAAKKKENTSAKKLSASGASRLPPRLVSDQMINIFFQEWAPLFPVVNRPTVLNLYTEYVANPHGVKDKHAIAQLNLIFGIAAVSAEVWTILPMFSQLLIILQWTKHNIYPIEAEWQAALDSVLSENTLPTLQCLVLAQIFCIAMSDYNKLLHYKGMAISLSHRLGLHQSQKRFSLGALTSESRKKVFWTLYTLDW